MRPMFLMIIMFLSFNAANAANTIIYVSGSGSDKNTGAEDSPLKNLDRAMGMVKPGDTVIVKNGTYTVNELIVRNGTSTSHITVKAENTGKVNIRSLKDKQGKIILGSFVDFSGFRIFGFKYGLHLFGNVEGIKVADCEIAECVNGVFVEPEGSYVPRKIHFLRVISHDNSSKKSSEGKGFYLNGMENGIVEDCEAYNNYSDAPGAGDGFGSYEKNINSKFINCYSHDNRHDGFDLWRASTVVNCRSYNNGDKGFKVWESGSSFVNCIAYGNQTGFTFLYPGSKTSTMVNCDSIYNGTTPRSWVAKGSLGHGVQIDPEKSGSIRLSIKNCIIAFNGVHEIWLKGPVSDLVEEDYNLYYHTAKSTDGVILAGTDKYAEAVIGKGKRWNMRTGKGANSFYGDPLFNSPDKLNFTLKAGSPALNKGAAKGAPDNDLSGSVRLKDNGYVDIGSYSFIKKGE